MISLLAFPKIANAVQLHLINNLANPRRCHLSNSAFTRNFNSLKNSFIEWLSKASWWTKSQRRRSRSIESNRERAKRVNFNNLGGPSLSNFLKGPWKIPHFPRNFISITCSYLSDHRERHKKQKDSGGGQRRTKATGRFRKIRQTLLQQFLERTMNYSPINLEASTFSRH